MDLKEKNILFYNQFETTKIYDNIVSEKEYNNKKRNLNDTNILKEKKRFNNENIHQFNSIQMVFRKQKKKVYKNQKKWKSLILVTKFHLQKKYMSNKWIGKIIIKLIKKPISIDIS